MGHRRVGPVVKLRVLIGELEDPVEGVDLSDPIVIIEQPFEHRDSDRQLAGLELQAGTSSPTCQRTSDRSDPERSSRISRSWPWGTSGWLALAFSRASTARNRTSGSALETASHSAAARSGAPRTSCATALDSPMDCRVPPASLAMTSPPAVTTQRYRPCSHRDQLRFDKTIGRGETAVGMARCWLWPIRS